MKTKRNQMFNYSTPQLFPILFIILISCFTFISCGDEDEIPSENVSLLPYNSTNHIYSTVADFNLMKQWEAVIDPTTGQYEKILETEKIYGGHSFPLGTKSLTAFDRNERIYVDEADDSYLKIQNLETFEEREILIKDISIDETVIFPQFIKFGDTQNEIYLLDTDDSIWKVRLDNDEVTRIYEKIPIENGTYIANFFFLEASSNFLLITNEENDNTGTEVLIFDPSLPANEAFIADQSIKSGFGFVQHPNQENRIYYMQIPNDETGLRLMFFSILNGEELFSSVQSSDTDLPLENLSFYIQTIHTASPGEAYILRGGSSSIENPSNYLYSVDLIEGTLISEVELNDIDVLLKLAGE